MTNNQKWSKERIIYMIRDWVSVYGDSPTVHEWEHNPCYPGSAVVKYWFGSWGNAMRAAGIAPRSRGKPGHLV